MNRSDVGVIERGRNFGFPLEASHAIGIAQERRRQDLERHLALEPGVAGAVDLAHSTPADGSDDFVVT
jgi:hypothetical protein